MRIRLIHLFATLLVLFCMGVLQVNSQGIEKVMRVKDFTEILKTYHPVAIQSNLLLRKGLAKVQESRGGFDPYLHGSYDNKRYEGKEYYGLFNGGLVVPTWYGIKVKTSVDQNNGEFLNLENSVPAGGLWAAGVSISLGKGLLIDKRRAALKQAQFFQKSTVVERQIMLNDLFVNGLKQYWNWVKVYNQLKIYEESLELALVRYNAVRESYKYGDNPAIDTLEAYLQVQNRQMFKNDYKLIYQKATLELSNYLWFENYTPLEITDSLRPPLLSDLAINESIPIDTFNYLYEQVSLSHPEIKRYSLKMKAIDLEIRLNQEALKPKVNLNYNLLNEQVGSALYSDFSSNNYKWGMEFSFPLFLREERGKLNQSKIKMESTSLSFTEKQLQLKNKVRSYYLKQTNLEQQVKLVSDAVLNYSRLLSGEKVKFNEGESSLFIVNSREVKMIQANLKLAEFITKYKLSHAEFKWAVGNLYEM